MLDSEYQSFRTILNSVITVTAENYSYLCFSDEETQADDYMSWVRSVRSVKKSAGWKQTPDFQKSNLAFQKNPCITKACRNIINEGSISEFILPDFAHSKSS